jgi:ArsR family transcriptional regulator
MLTGYRVHLADDCDRCSFKPEHSSQLEIHHLDSDRSNNEPSNLQTLCANCHALVHRTARGFHERGKRPQKKRLKPVMTVDMDAAARHSEKFKAISDPTRLAMIACLNRVGEVCVTDLMAPFELSQSTISHHLRLLRRAGLVEATRIGTLSFYRVVPSVLEELQCALVDACLEI